MTCFTNAESYRMCNLKEGDPDHNFKVGQKYAFYREVENGHLNTIEQLYFQGATIDTVALCIAAYRGNLNVVKFLCENGAEITNNVLTLTRNALQYSVVDYLVANRNGSIVAKRSGSFPTNSNYKNNNANTEEQNPPNAQDCW
jgi:hypothetical protein